MSLSSNCKKLQALAIQVARVLTGGSGRAVELLAVTEAPWQSGGVQPASHWHTELEDEGRAPCAHCPWPEQLRAKKNEGLLEIADCFDPKIVCHRRWVASEALGP